MLVVAPRGRLSWIPNITGAPTFWLPPLHGLTNKTRRRRKNLKESLAKPVMAQHGWIRHKSQKILKEIWRGQEEGRRRVQEGMEQNFYSSAQLFICFSVLIQLHCLLFILKSFLVLAIILEASVKERWNKKKKEKREVKSSEDEKTELGPNSKLSASKVSFFFSLKSRGDDDGGMRSGGETLSPAAPQDWTPKPKNPTGLP